MTLYIVLYLYSLTFAYRCVIGIVMTATTALTQPYGDPMTPTASFPKLSRLLKRYAASEGKDMITYIGEIHTQGYYELEQLVLAKPPNASGAILTLVTDGGYIEAAHKIVTLLQKRYPDGYKLYVPRHCKSAGTFIALGAKALLLNSYKSELGPIDPQSVRKNDVATFNSGLAADRILKGLCQSSFSFCQDSIRRLLHDPIIPMGCEQASQIGVQLTRDLFGPLIAKVDLHELGDQALFTRTVLDYGAKAIARGQNCDMATVEKLATEYGSHTFVIDQDDARLLFKSVQHPDPKLDDLGDALAELGLSGPNSFDEEQAVYVGVASAPLGRYPVGSGRDVPAGGDRQVKTGQHVH